MKQNLLIIIWTFLPLLTVGQKIELTGTVVDSTDQLGFPMAKIELIKNDSTLLTTKTDFEGHFKIDNLKGGFYRLNIRAIGYPEIEVTKLNLTDESNDIKIELTNPIELEPVDIEWKYFTIIDSTGTIRCVKKTE
ncbi:MAG: hypothetical protein CMI36_14910 [Owenweeksia sp.]|mgnify:CR=1 FL=1|nr:hypothetical protein [Owenweeksia sp.]MBG00282.1 hypothetical protein [Owenweeksia sp.]HBF21698.1 hypothetical protein [Cryomorphaceae bacterium]|tara:strand:- start:634 stop:1038 length:405 start_codon:yes stop_codon:yes gene_type:complete